VTWSAGQTTALTLELAGEYPKVASIIPANTECTVTVDRKALAAATIKAAAITKAAAGANTPVRLVVSPAGITVAPSVETGQGQVRAPELDATITGITEMTIGANPTFLGDMLAAFAGETVTLHLDAPSKPFVATNEPTGLTDPGAYLHVLMPVRVTD
jgi:DNA polymerase-3 subunit beta